MKLSYVLQLKDFSLIFSVGAIVGAIYGLFSHFPILKRNIVLKNISNFFLTIITFIAFTTSILYINLGEFRLFLLVGYVLGIILERITLGKLFAKGYVWVYNMLEIFYKRFKSSKLGGIIFK